MAGEVQAAFDNVYVDGPAGNPNSPLKSEIRNTVGGTIQSQIDGIKTDIAGTNNSISSVASDVATLNTEYSGHETRIDNLESNAATGMHAAQAVATRTTANVALASGGVAAGTTHGGYTVSTGDRILVMSQTAGAENGIYIVPASGAASRSTDADAGTELSGISVKALYGTYAGRTFTCTTTGTITVGTTALTFSVTDDDGIRTRALQALTDSVRHDLGSSEPGVHGGALKPARVRDHSARAGIFSSSGGTRQQWLCGFTVGADDRIDAVKVILDDEGRGPVTIEALLYKQPTSLASASLPADISQYELIDTFSAPAARYFTVGGGEQYVTLPVPSKPSIKKGERYCYVVRLRDGASALLPFAMGGGRHYGNDEESFAQGAFSTTTTLSSFQAISAGFKVYHEVQALRRTVPLVNRALVPVDGRLKGSAWGSDFYRVSLNIRPSREVKRPGALGFWVSQAQNAVYLRLRVVLRPYSDGNYGTTGYAIGSGANDKMVYCRDYTTADLYDTGAIFASEEQFVTLDLDGMPAVGRDQIALFEVTPLLSDRLTATTVRIAQAPALATGEIELLRGSYSTNSSPGQVQNTATPHHYVLMEAVESDRAGEQEATPFVDRVMFLDPVQEFQTTTGSVALPRMAVWLGDRMEIIPAQTVALTNVLTPEVINDSVTMRYNQNNPLSCRWVGSATVTRVSDSVVLVEDTDYTLRSPEGTIKGLQNIADTAVTVSYSGYRGRCDLITYFPGSTEYQVFEGTARLADPDNWKVDEETIGSNARMAVADVLVTRTGVEVIDKTRVRPRSRVIVGRENEVESIRDWNRQQLAPALLELQRGNNITYIAYGDSISGWTGGWEPEWQTVPGGPSRDTKGALTIQTPDDSLTHIGLPGVVEGDGVTHWYGSYHRRMQTTLQNRFGVTVDFKNLGIGGTDAGSGGTGIESDRYGGSNATRMAGILAAKGVTGKTIVGIAFGTNDADSDQLVNQLTTIARYCLTNGMIPMLIGQPALGYSVVRTVRRQQRNDGRILRTARTVPCAYVPLGLITHENRAGSGIFRSLQATAGSINHPGAHEHGVYADWIDFMCFR